MDIKLEREEEIQYLGTGIAQMTEECCFIQAALAVGNECLYFYSDNTPDSLVDDIAFYKIKRMVTLDQIKLVMKEKIKNNPELKCYRRIRIICGDPSTNCSIYYTKKQKKNFNNIYSYLKYKNIKCKRKSVDLSPLY